METTAAEKYRQLITFRLDDEEYGIETKKIRHIEEMMPYTRVPGAPDYIKGVINLRGEIVPLMSIRKRFGMEEKETDENTRIIILSSDNVTAGIIVDEVIGTLQIAEDDIESLFAHDSDTAAEFVSGAGKVNNRVITILNAERFLKI